MQHELLFGRRPKGLLDIAKEPWEDQPSPFHTTTKHMKEMQGYMNKVGPIVHQYLLSAQPE